MSCEHSWTPPVRVDQCHFILEVQSCVECGATVETEVLRDFDLHPLDVSFASEDCAECRRLMNEPSGYVPDPEDLPF